MRTIERERERKSGALDWMRQELTLLQEKDRLRSVTDTEILSDGWLLRGGRRMLNLASNHYLGLEQPMAKESGADCGADPRHITGLVRETSLRMDSSLDPGAVLGRDSEAYPGGSVGTDSGTCPQSAAVRDSVVYRGAALPGHWGLDTRHGYKLGATASRLIAGNHPMYTELEEAFAAFKGTESCLLFGGGYMANIGVIPAIAGRNDTIFSDRLNHASITDGIILSRAGHQRYKHRDLEHLEFLLRRADPGGRRLIVTDSIFSMDGSIAPLQELVELKERYGAMLMVDEAHSGGLYGPEGQGLVYALGLTDHVDIQMGTFSKAYGTLGAYIAGSAVLREFLLNKARSLIYTTALPPLMVEAIYSAWQQARQEDWRRKALQQKAAWMRGMLQARGFHTGESECHIIPLLLGEDGTAVRFNSRLQEEGIAAAAVRPPTVPEGTARIRLTLMATHREEDLQWAVERMSAIRRELQVEGTQ